MSENNFNYEQLKFKCGLEIHQQLDAGGKKLFCHCPSFLRKDEPDFTVKRKLHSVPGESGEVDVAAGYQTSLGKEFIYQGYDTTCLVELDEEPPYEINEDALMIALHVSFLLNCEIVPIGQIMRKTVLDGSNTSGFQRSVLIAENGWVESEQGRVGIRHVYLEEDAARIIDRDKEKEIYRLDRLGIPLIEIVTEPDIKSPEQAKEVALKIGEILRSCRVKRGIGTIRQDVNISIRGENRVEIKGMQDMSIFVRAIETEILRQKELLDKSQQVQREVREVLPDATSEFMRPMPGAARMYPETDLPLLKISKQFIDDSRKTLPKPSSELRAELRSYGLHEELIKLILQSGKIEELRELSFVIRKPDLIAKMLVLFPRELASKKNLGDEEVDEILNKDVLVDILDALKRKKINESQVKSVMERILDGNEFGDALKFDEHDLNEVEEKVMKLVKEKPRLSINAYMGILMKEFKGKVDAGSLMEIVGKYVGRIGKV